MDSPQTNSQRLGDLPKSFLYAGQGLWYLLRNQRNARIHLLLAVLAVVLALVLRLSFVEWAVLALAIGLVIAAEAFNTAVEALVDLVSPEHHQLAKVAKDTAAGAVLVAAMASIVVALFLFLPGIIQFIQNFFVPAP